MQKDNQVTCKGCISAIRSLSKINMEVNAILCLVCERVWYSKELEGDEK